jgi:tetratricopeptide (TPR) repeat protein
LARAYSVLDLAYRWSGQPEKAAFGPKALAIYEELGDLNGQEVVHGNMGVEAYFDGRWGDAIDHYRKSRDASRRTGNEVHAAYSESNMAEVLVNQGRIEEAKPLLEGAHRVLLATDFIDGASLAEVQLARILAAGGHIEEAVELYDKARRQYFELGETKSIAELVVYLAQSYLEAGRPQDAIAELDEAESVLGEDTAVYSAGILRVRGLALTELGHSEEARAAVASGLEIAEDQGLPYEMALLLLAKDRLEQGAFGEPGTPSARGLEILDELGVEVHPELGSSV